MRFIETPIFTEAIVALVDDEIYRQLQLTLIQRPTLGALIKHSGGLRKMRWAPAGRGKRGGLRIIYYWDAESESFFMLYVYAKNEREDLTVQQLRALSRIVREEFG